MLTHLARHRNAPASGRAEIIMRSMKIIKYIIFLLFCLAFSNCDFLNLVVIEEPENGFETTDSEIAVKGHYSIYTDMELTTLELTLNDVVVGIKQVGIGDEIDYGSFEFLHVNIPNGHIRIKVTGYSEYYTPNSANNNVIDSDEVSIYCDSLPPNIVISNPAYNDTIYATNVTFNGSISDNDEVKKFFYIGEYGHSGIVNTLDGNWSVTIESLPYEFQYISFRAIDRLGNEGRNTIYFTCSAE